MEICSTDLVLRCIGGNQDGKLIPVKTKKCLLGHGFDPKNAQKSTAKAAIFRGPNGAAVRTYCPKTTVNGLKSTVSWIQEGDQIRLPNLTIEIQQLGQWPSQHTNSAPSTDSSPQSSHIANSQTELPMNTEPSTQADLELEAKIEAMRQKMSQIQNEVDAIDQEDSPASNGLESTGQVSTEMSATSLIDETLAKIEASNEEDQTPEPQPKTEAPKTESVAEVLARMQATGQIGGLDPELEQEPSFEPQESTPEVFEEPKPESIAEPPAEEEGGDVQDYMNQLFQRLRGPAAGAAASAKANSSTTSKTPEKPTDVAKPGSAIEKVNVHKPVELLSADEFKPKKIAPERDSNLDAMRELANQNARNAVKLSRSKRQGATRTAQLVIAAGGILGSVVLFFLSAQIGDAFFCGGVGSALAGLVAGGRYVATNVLKKKTSDSE